MQVSLVQLNTALGESMYLPYSVALLQAYTERHARRPERYAFGLPMVHCPDVRRGADALSGADIVGFSTYVWNANRHRAIARELRARNEHTLIMFGGPHVPDHAEQLLRENPFVDVVCHGSKGFWVGASSPRGAAVTCASRRTSSLPTRRSRAWPKR